MASQLGRIRAEGFLDSHQFSAPVHTRVMTRGKRAPEVTVAAVAPPKKPIGPIAAGLRERLFERER